MMEDFGALVEAMLNLVRDGGLFARGVLDGHVAGLVRVRAEYPWAAAQVSAHNDINPRNVLFDGERLWLVDWELAFRNDPLADVANIANNFSEAPNVDTLVLEGWLGRSPDVDTRRRLTLMRDLQRLFAGCLLLSEFIGRARAGGRAHRADARPVPRRDHAWRAPGDTRAALRAGQDAPRRLRRRNGREDVVAVDDAVTRAGTDAGARWELAGYRRAVMHIAPIFPVRDVAAALAFYERLGFVTRTFHEGGCGYATADGVEIHLGAIPADRRTTPASAYLFVDDANEVAARWVAAGIDVAGPEDTSWERREGAIVDPDGNIIRFGSALTAPSARGQRDDV